MADAAKSLVKAPTQRSAATNDRLAGTISTRGLVVEGDGRTVWARRYRDLVALTVDDAGGLEAVGEVKLALIRRFSALCVEAERMESALARGEAIDMPAFTRIADVSRRLGAEIGLKRVLRPGARIASAAERMRAQKA